MRLTMKHWYFPDQKSAGPLASLIIILLAAAIISPDFLRITFVDGHLSGSLLDVLHRGAPTALLALGMAIVIGTKGIDLSVGSVVAICGAVSAYLLTQTELPFILVVLLTVAAGMTCGLWNGILVSVIGIQPIVATLILMVAGRGIAQMISGGQIVTFQSGAMDLFGNGYFLLMPVRVWVVATIIILTMLLMRKTALGLFFESVGANHRASRLVGIEARTLLILAYVFSGLCASIAGMIVAADIRGADANNAGLWLELDAILAVVLAGASLNGGRIFLGLTIVGVLIIQSITTAIYTIGWPPQYNLIVKAAIVLVVLLLQSPKTRNYISSHFGAKENL